MAAVNRPFGATTTAMEVVRGVNLRGKRAIVTGASSGIGLETARALAAAGAEVTLAVRDQSAGRAVAKEISTSLETEVRIASLDLAVHGSVISFVEGWKGPLDILVNNAGIMASPEQHTIEGWEMQFATNHLGHFALSVGLHPALKQAGRSRVVVVSSVGHINGDVQFDDINFESHPYDPWKAYSQSKTANILFAVEAAKRWAQDGIVVNALNPGRIGETNLARYMTADANSVPATFEPNSQAVSYKNVEQGAATSVFLAASPLVEGVSGKYFEDCVEAAPHQPGVRRGYAAYAVAAAPAGKLWQISLDMIAEKHPNSPILLTS